MFSQESTADIVTDLLGRKSPPCAGNTCPVSSSSSGWGAVIPVGVCPSGGDAYLLGLQIESHKTVHFEGQARDPLTGTCTTPYEEEHVITRMRNAVCPSGSSPDPEGQRCIRDPMLQCPAVHNPVAIDAGAKMWSEQISDFPAAFGGLQLKYNSMGHVPDVIAAETAFSYWKLSFTQRVQALEGINAIARIVESDGRTTYYGMDGNEFIKSEGRATHLQRVPASGPLTGWTRSDRRGGTEQFDANGRLTSVQRSDGARLTLTWQNGVLTRIEDQSGRRLDLEWSEGLLQRIHDAQGNVAVFAYSPVGQLVSLTFADGAIRRYGYAGLHRHLLTEIRDGDLLYADYSYDTEGRVQRSRTFADDDSVVSERQYGYWLNSPDYFVGVTNALGGTESYTFRKIANTWRVVAASDNCPNCGTSNWRRAEYDSNGFPSVTMDMRGTTAEHVHDAIGRRTQLREGLPYPNVPGSFCPVGTQFYPGSYGITQCTDTCWSTSPFPGSVDATPYNWPGWHASCAVPPPTSADIRRTDITWHASFNVPLTTTLTHEATSAIESVRKSSVNARGQVTASCEVDPANGSAMAYTCGSSINAPTGVRQTSYDYCDTTDPDWNTAACPLEGRLKSVNGPRTDVSDLATRSYYAADHATCATAPATCPYRKGDLWKTTDALANVTEFLAYDASGRLLRQKDPNGVITDLAYGPRGWLATRTLRANADGSPNPAQDAVTRLEYEPYGDIRRVLQPDGSGLEYCRDRSHRIQAVVETTLASASRCVGPQPVVGAPAIVYTLDAAGNRVREEVRDGGGQVRRLLARQYSTLSRLIATISAPYASAPDLDDPAVRKTSFIYGASEQVERTIDPLGREQRSGFDALRRLIESTQDADTPTGSGETPATVQYQYDARDNLRKVIDPKGLSTEYVYDGLNNQTQLSSPDTGTTTYTYDAAGNRRSQTDARGVVTNYTYDALNRLRTIAYPSDTAKNITFTYDTVQSGCAADEGASKGRLVRIQDVTGQTRMCFDARGNLKRKIQVTGGRTLTTQYSYNAANRLTGMTYPSGLVVAFSRDTQGRVVGVQLSRGAWSLPLVTSASWLPFGPLASLQFGNGQTLSKSWDQNYWPDAVGGSTLDYDFATNEVGNIVTVASASEGTQHLGYDRLDRLSEVRDANQALIEAYTYDATGNRLSQQLGTSPATSYSYPATSHRLTAVGAGARSFDAVGNTLSGIPGYESDSAVYDARNRLTQVGSPSAQLLANYNGRGERVLASQGSPAPALPTTSAAWTSATGVRGQVYDEQGQLISSLIGGNPLRYEEIVWIDNIPVGRVLSSTSAVLEVHAIHSDHLNTPRALANAQSQGGQAAGTVVWRWRLNATSASGSNAFGTQAADENPDGNGTSVRFDLRFPGQQFDASVGLSYNYFRDYEPSTGRYVESDPIGLRGGVSTYGYVGGQPILVSDPLGLSKEDVLQLVNAFWYILDDMTGDGLRSPSPTHNNHCARWPDSPFCGPEEDEYLDCGDQADYMMNELSELDLDDTWTFEQHSGFGHSWASAVSSNPEDPILWFDPRASDYSIGEPCPTCRGWFFGWLDDPRLTTPGR